MEQYLHIQLVTEPEKSLLPLKEGLMVIQIEGEEGLHQVIDGAWQYIGGRPPRR